MQIDYDTLFFSVDNFCQNFEPWYKGKLLSYDRAKKYRNRSYRLHLSEVVTIMVAYHQSGMTCFKYFYCDLYNHHRYLFPNMVHYERFVTLIKRALVPMSYMLQSLMGKVSEYLFVDSTPMTVCHNLREKRHRVFKASAAKGKTSTGYFFGFKLHMIFNTLGQIVRLVITPGNVDDRRPVRQMMKNIKAKLIGDKGYISQDLADDLLKCGSHLITRVKRNMKNKLLSLKDKAMLMKRSFIETIFSSMKLLNTLIHDRHRCPINAFAHVLAGLIRYQLRDDKPTVKSSV